MATVKRNRVKVWFSHLLPNDESNTGLTVTQRRKKAEKQIPALLRNSTFGKEWNVHKISWKSPVKPSKRHRITVKIKPKDGKPPGDAKIPQVPSHPPPTM